KALEQAIKVALPGNRVGHISQKIQEIIEGAGYYPVPVLTGHGIGRKLHEEPFVPGVLFEKIEKTPALVVGMTLAIEIIYGLGTGEVVLKNDGWTVCTKDGKIAGLFEKTIAITENGPLILTPVGER
ncbi:MAG: M24 family metallopeptidase, partial [Microgenomates group bacterium]